ncbi:macrophage mannose receptor 1-like [Acipenser ruthenus]|uniref:macrophage mannose receptor 1-like n=1 Tax=Acipenser ruthenus TaxID=7906 RepID=UPI0027409C0D|nr:macrophage mannose receptor 1-like [Acipenser ruthenus]
MAPPQGSPTNKGGFPTFPVFPSPSFLIALEASGWCLACLQGVRARWGELPPPRGGGTAASLIAEEMEGGSSPEASQEAMFCRFCVPAYNQIRKHVFVETVMSWSGAQSYCREKHTDLATVRSQEEAEQLLNIAGASLWGSWIGLYRDDTQNWQWSNSDDVIYSNWRADVFCASVNSDGKWTDLPCHLQEAFMCYKETSNITERYTLIEELKTWTEAQQYCREHHTDLVSIKNASENEDLVKKAQGKPFWIGLFNEPWKWSHQGDNYTFHTWNYGEPNNRGGDQNCVMMSKTGEWFDYGCNNQKSFFCCEVEFFSLKNMFSLIFIVLSPLPRQLLWSVFL